MPGGRGYREGEITSTVVGRVEPHNLRLVHPTQDRTISMRENARAQARPAHSASAPTPSGGRKLE